METLRRNVILNLPYFLNSLLHETALRLKISKYQASVLSHHGIVKLIIVRGFNQGQLSWEYLLGNPEAPLEVKAHIEDFGNFPPDNEQPYENEEVNPK